MDRRGRIVKIGWVNNWHSGTPPEQSASTIRAHVALDWLKGSPIAVCDIGDCEAHELLRELSEALCVCTRVRADGGAHASELPLEHYLNQREEP